MTDINELWQKTEQVLRQLPAGVYAQHIPHTTLIDVTGNTWTLETSEPSAEWLSRFPTILLNAIQEAHGLTPDLSFQVAANGHNNDRALEPEAFDAQPALDSRFVRNIDFIKLWFEKGGSGFDRVAKYWSRYWRIYLNQLNKHAFGLWEYLAAPDLRDQTKLPYWTAARRYQGRTLAREMGCSPAMITGGFRNCSVFDNALADGQCLEECCAAHLPAEMRTNQYGQPQCRFWREGAFEVLYREGLLAIRLTGDTPKNTFHHLQIWRMLPLLTPHQAGQLPDSQRQAHADWIELQAGKGFFNANEWHQLAAKSLVDQMAGRDQGRSFYDTYQPNPLLDSMESNNQLQPTLLDSMESNNPIKTPLLDSMESNRTQ